MLMTVVSLVWLACIAVLCTVHFLSDTWTETSPGPDPEHLFFLESVDWDIVADWEDEVNTVIIPRSGLISKPVRKNVGQKSRDIDVPVIPIPKLSLTWQGK